MVDHRDVERFFLTAKAHRTIHLTAYTLPCPGSAKACYLEAILDRELAAAW